MLHYRYCSGATLTDTLAVALLLLVKNNCDGSVAIFHMFYRATLLFHNSVNNLIEFSLLKIYQIRFDKTSSCNSK